MATSRETDPRPSRPVPAAFAAALSEVARARARPEVVVSEATAPTRLAPHAVALTADVVLGRDEVGTGRLVLLYDPAGHEAWAGTFRFVAYARAEIEADMAADPLLCEVAWTWLTDALDQRAAEYTAVSGTVTRVASEGFGGMADDPGRAEVELRASWSPVGRCTEHVEAWSDLLCSAAGLPPAAPSVVSIRSVGRTGPRLSRTR